MLAEGGCDDTEIGMILGWKREYVAAMRARYQATDAKAADRGVRKLERQLKKREDHAKQSKIRSKADSKLQTILQTA